MPDWAHRCVPPQPQVIEMENTNPPRYLHTAICILSVAAAFTLCEYTLSL